MGIFDVNMPLLYGEGDKAFRRLQDEIMKFSDDQSLFAWGRREIYGGFLAPHPSHFFGAANIIPSSTSSGAISVNNEGIHLRVSMGLVGFAILQCAANERRVAVAVRAIPGKEGHFVRVPGTDLKLLDPRE